jgi:hypothetical protein
MVGNIVPVKTEGDGQYFIGFAIREILGPVLYNTAAIERPALLEFCVIIRMKTEVELDGRLEEKVSDDEKKPAGSGII